MAGASRLVAYSARKTGCGLSTISVEEKNLKFYSQTEPGTIIAQMDIGTGSADLKLYGPDETEIISKRVSEVGMVHHTTSDLGEYYLLIGDGSVNRLDYELILDII